MQTEDTLHRMCACDHEEQTHDESGTCKGTIDGESDCKCVSFCFDGRLYDDEIGEIVERTQATFEPITRDEDRYTIAWCQCGHAPPLHGEDGQCNGAQACDGPPVLQCTCRSFRPGTSLRAQLEKT